MAEEEKILHLRWRVEKIKKVAELITRYRHGIDEKLKELGIPEPLKCVYYNFIFDYILLVKTYWYWSPEELINLYMSYGMPEDKLREVMEYAERIVKVEKL